MEQCCDGVPPLAEDTRAAVSRLFELYVDDVHAYLSRRLGVSYAADLTSETFRIALERYATFDSTIGHERAWLYGIASNLLRGHRRSEERRWRAISRAQSLPLLRIDPLIRVEESLDAELELASVAAALSRMTSEDRDLVTLYAWERLSYSQISIALEIPVGTVRSRINRIRKFMRHNTGDDN
jgi:RNA polymerase sigma factor (sigma-70 family)